MKTPLANVLEVVSVICAIFGILLAVAIITVAIRVLL